MKKLGNALWWIGFAVMVLAASKQIIDFCVHCAAHWNTCGPMIWDMGIWFLASGLMLAGILLPRLPSDRRGD